MKLQIDVLGVFRFISIPADRYTVEQYISQIEYEFDEVYHLKQRLNIQSIVKARASTIEISFDKLVENVFSDGDLIHIFPEAEWIDTLKLKPWLLVDLSQQQFETRVQLIRQIFGQEAKLPIIRSCLLRASGDVSKATAICAYLRPDVLNVQHKVLFIRVGGPGQGLGTMRKGGHSLIHPIPFKRKAEGQ